MHSVADLVNALFETHRKPNGSPYTNREVAFALAKFGVEIDPSSLSKVRNGKTANPGRDTLLGLCRVFKIPPSFFFPEIETVELPAPSSPADQLQLALQANGLSPEVQEKIEQLVQALRPKH